MFTESTDCPQEQERKGNSKTQKQLLIVHDQVGTVFFFP